MRDGQPSLRKRQIGPPRPPCADCGDDESTIYFERDGEWACDEPILCMERQRDQANADLGAILHSFLAYENAPLADQPTYRAELIAKVRGIFARRLSS